MRSCVSFLAGLTALTSFMSIAAGDVKTDAEAKVRYEVPEGFNASGPGKVVLLTEPKEEVAFFLLHADESDLDKARVEVDEVVGSYVNGLVMDAKSRTATYNGMKAIQVKGTGQYHARPVNVTLRILQTPNHRAFVVAGVYVSAKKVQLMDTFNRFYNRVVPAT